MPKKIPWTYKTLEEVTIITVTRQNGDKHEVMIDTEDLNKLLPHSINLKMSRGGMLYARINAYGSVQLLHRFLLGLTDPNDQCDHRDRDTLNYRKTNLRPSTHIENMQNLSINRTNTSGVTGVSRHKGSGKWTTQVWHNGVRRHLGYFTDFADAVDAVRKFKVENKPFSQEAVDAEVIQ
jgi:hypothetical protein